MKRCAIYVRVSTSKQVEEGFSIPQQTDRLQRYCEAMDWEIVGIYVDDGYSGASLNRPKLQLLLQDIKRGIADIVLVDKLDRLSRSQLDTMYLIQKEFDVNGVAFVSRAEAFDTSTPFGKAAVGILAVFAELERSRIKERMADGKEGRAKAGKYMGTAMVLVGYDYIDDELIVNEYEAMQVKECFELFCNRTPISDIVKAFNLKGYKQKYGDWTRQRVMAVLKNKTYAGKIRHKGKFLDGNHQPIISESVWERAQQILNENKSNNPNRYHGNRYVAPLGGMVFCSHCGGRYHWRSNAKNADGTKRSYYICYSRENTVKSMVKGECHNRIFRDAELEQAVFNEIRKLAIDDTYINELTRPSDELENKKILTKRIASISSQIDRLINLYAIEGLNYNDVKSKIESLQEEKKSLECQINAITEHRLEPVEIKTLASTLDACVGDKDKLHNLCCELIERIDINDDEVNIHWKF